MYSRARLAEVRAFQGGTKITLEQVDDAATVLIKTGVRLMCLDGGNWTGGVWSDLDGPRLRAAIDIMFPDVPVAYLDGAGIPDRYKLRQVPGEPVPAHVLELMQQDREAGWRERDALRWMSAEEWDRTHCGVHGPMPVQSEVAPPQKLKFGGAQR